MTPKGCTSRSFSRSFVGWTVYLRLTPLTRFGLWIEPEGAAAPVRAEALTVDEATRTGRGHAVVDGGRFTLRVTAEPSADVEQPSERVIIATVLEPAD